MNRNIASILFTAAGIVTSVAAEKATAGTINLTDLNSTVAITPSASNGLTSWTINGTNIAVSQWFWYAVDGGVQNSLDTLGLTSTSTFSDGSGTEGAVAVYSGSNGLSVKLVYLLTGGSISGESDLQESISLTNTTTASQAYRFYQYSNYNLSGGSADRVQFTNLNTVSQTGGTLALQTVMTPVPNEWEGSTFPNTLNHLTGGSAYTLNDSPPVGGTVGPGNVTWADEWDPTILAGNTVLISEGQLVNPFNPVPEPTSLSLLFAACGAALLVGISRPRRVRA